MINYVISFHQGNEINFSRDLLRLNVGRNSLQDVPSKALQSLKNLNQLDLSFNKIKDIKKDTFLGMEMLATVDTEFEMIYLL